MDDKIKAEYETNLHINVDELYELQYWSEKLIVNQSDIIEAAHEVGSEIEEIKKFLRNKALLF